MAARIGLTGDVMLGRTVDRRHSRRDVEAVWGECLGTLQGLDGVLVNLECCLSTLGRPWRRTHRPFHFRASPDWAVPALQRADIDACALANNHVLDFEVPALLDTLEHLDEAGISHAGAGRTRPDAFEPATFRAGDLRIGVVSWTDNTPEYAATDDSPGTAHLEIDSGDPAVRSTVTAVLERVRSAEPDVVIASLHWGPNMVEKPPTAFRVFARWLVDRGVDLVHGHSAHVFQGIEVYDGCPILYDTGDFVDDYAVDDRLRNDRSFLFEAVVSDSGSVRELRLRPTEIRECAVTYASGQAAAWSRSKMRELSRDFGTTFDRDGERLVLSIEG